MKFGLHLDNGSAHDVETLLTEWRAMVQLADTSGFQYVSVVDHLAPFPDFRARDLPLLDSWQLLSTYAGLTSNVTLFSLVNNGSLRHPVRLAKQLSSLDVLSEGRMAFGVGAGGYDLDEDALGFTVSEARERYARLDECISLVRKLWRGEPVTYQGEFYSLQEVVSSPVPRHDPMVLVAGKSARILNIGARAASAINFAFPTNKELTGLVRALEAELDQEGRSLQDFEVTVLDRIFLSETSWQASGAPVVNGHPGLVGSARELVDLIKKRQELGMDTLLCMFPDLKSLRVFVHDVLPEFS